MKRGMSRGEWLLICGPVVLFGVFAAFYVRWKATAPATLNPSPYPLRNAVPIYDGRSIIALSEETDAQNVHVPGTPWHFLRWNTKDGSLSSQFDESRRFYNWNFSRDGELLAMHIPALFSAPSGNSSAGTMVVRNTNSGSEIASWPTSITSPFLGSMSISPDKREIVTLSERLERHDLMSGKVLGYLKASQIFSPKSSFERIGFSPDGRLIAITESALYLPEEDSSAAKTIGSTSARVGGRMSVLTFPGLKPVLRPQGDMYADLSWESNERLWGIATFYAGYTLHKLVRAHIDLRTKQTHLDVLELPTDYTAWNQKTLSINGLTGQVVLSGDERAGVWGPDGKIEISMNFTVPPVPTGGRLAPGTNAPLRFSRDGRSLFRVNGTNIERYDLSRFLPAATPAQTSTP